ncbi:MAG: cohesin domain-containing protein [Methanosarcinaceae archaeon]
MQLKFTWRFLLTSLVFIISVYSLLLANEGTQSPGKKPNHSPAISVLATESQVTAVANSSLKDQLWQEIINGTEIGGSNLIYATAYYGRNVAVGIDSVIHIVWSNQGALANEVLYVRSTDHGQQFSAPVAIHDGYYGYKPAIAVDPVNPQNIFVAYVGYQSAGESRSVRAVKSSDGGLTWGASIPIHGGNLNCNNPDIIVDSKGNPHCVFDNYTDNWVRYNYSEDGGITWGAAVLVLNSEHTIDSFCATLAIEQNRYLHVLWGGDGGVGMWGDKTVFWNWLDLEDGYIIKNVPPVAISTLTKGTPYPSMVWDSQGTAHVWFDATKTEGGRSVYYVTYENEIWSTPVAIPSAVPNGNTYMPSAAIDPEDNLYVIYRDAFENNVDLENNNGDIFVGTNYNGTWEYFNLTNTGVNIYERYPIAAREVVDGRLHLVYTGGPSGGPYAIIHEIGYSTICETPSLKPADVSGFPGNTITVNIEIADNPNPISPFGFKFNYDHNKLSFVEIRKGELTTAFDYLQAVESTPGIITVGGLAANSSIPAQSIGSLAQLVFQVTQCTEGEQSNFLITDVVDDLAGLNVCKGKFFCEQICQLGDVNMDNDITSGDALCAFKIFLNNGTVPPGECDNTCALISADANCNGSITTEDALIIFMAYLERKDPPLECPGNALAAYSASNEEDAALVRQLKISHKNSSSTDEVTFSIQLDHPLGINAFSFDLGFPEKLLTFVQAGPADLTHDWFVVAGQQNLPGVVTLGGFNAQNIGAENPGTLVEVTFQLKNTGWGRGDLWLFNLVDQLENAVCETHAFQNSATGVLVEDKNAPTTYALQQNYPNPFNMATEIIYQLPRAGTATISVYNSLGQKIRTLISAHHPAGDHRVRWDGLDADRQEVPSGIYIYELRATNYAAVKKMLILR